ILISLLLYPCPTRGKSRCRLTTRCRRRLTRCPLLLPQKRPSPQTHLNVGVRPLKHILAKFSAWTPWSERLALPLELPGVYMLSEFQESPPQGTPSLSSKLIYIGETCGQSLRGRLYQFNRSGFLGKFGHSGGATFARTFQAQPDP